MSRLLILVVFLAVAFDFAAPDAVLLVANARILQSDDEEESVPSRRQRVVESEHRIAVFPEAHGSVETRVTQPSTERRAHAERISDQGIWRMPFKQALMPSVPSASPSDAH